MMIIVYYVVFFSGIYDGKPAEYAFMWLFNWLALVVSFEINLNE